MKAKDNPAEVKFDEQIYCNDTNNVGLENNEIKPRLVEKLDRNKL